MVYKYFNIILAKYFNIMDSINSGSRITVNDLIVLYKRIFVVELNIYWLDKFNYRFITNENCEPKFSTMRKDATRILCFFKQVKSLKRKSYKSKIFNIIAKLNMFNNYFYNITIVTSITYYFYNKLNSWT